MHLLNISMGMVEHRLDIAFFDVRLIVVNIYLIIATSDRIVFKHAFSLSFISQFILLDALPSFPFVGSSRLILPLFSVCVWLILDSVSPLLV